MRADPIEETRASLCALAHSYLIDLPIENRPLVICRHSLCALGYSGDSLSLVLSWNGRYWSTTFGGDLLDQVRRFGHGALHLYVAGVSDLCRRVVREILQRLEGREANRRLREAPELGMRLAVRRRGENNPPPPENTSTWFEMLTTDQGNESGPQVFGLVRGSDSTVRSVSPPDAQRSAAARAAGAVDFVGPIPYDGPVPLATPPPLDLDADQRARFGGLELDGERVVDLEDRGWDGDPRERPLELS